MLIVDVLFFAENTFVYDPVWQSWQQKTGGQY